MREQEDERAELSVSQPQCHVYVSWPRARLICLSFSDMTLVRHASPLLSPSLSLSLSFFLSLFLLFTFHLCSSPPTLIFLSLSPLPMPDGCQGSKDNGCDCQQFIPKRSKQSRCKTCGHRDTIHLNTQSTPPTPPGGPAKPTAKPEVNYGGRVLKSFGASMAHKTARKETLLGYRPPPNEVCIVKNSHLCTSQTD